MDQVSMYLLWDVKSLHLDAFANHIKLAREIWSNPLQACQKIAFSSAVAKPGLLSKSAKASAHRENKAQPVYIYRLDGLVWSMVRFMVINAWDMVRNIIQLSSTSDWGNWGWSAGFAGDSSSINPLWRKAARERKFVTTACYKEDCKNCHDRLYQQLERTTKQVKNASLWCMVHKWHRSMD